MIQVPEQEGENDDTERERKTGAGDPSHPRPAAEAEERRLAPMMRALKAIHSASSPESMRPEDLKRQRAAQEVLGRLITPMIGMKWAPLSWRG